MLTTEQKLVTCPRCGMTAWQPRLEKEGCSTCRILDSR